VWLIVAKEHTLSLFYVNTVICTFGTFYFFNRILITCCPDASLVPRSALCPGNAPSRASPKLVAVRRFAPDNNKLGPTPHLTLRKPMVCYMSNATRPSWGRWAKKKASRKTEDRRPFSLKMNFSDYQNEARLWITLSTGEYYPDVLPLACELYQPVLVTFGHLIDRAHSSKDLFMQIAELQPQWMRIQVCRVFRKYVSP
jgi:hypothetical protein